MTLPAYFRNLSEPKLNSSDEIVKSDDVSPMKELRKKNVEIISNLKTQLEEELEKEEIRLRADYAKKMKELQLRTRDEHLEEESHLQEGLQDAIRMLKSELKLKQAEEEEQLRKTHNEALEKFQTMLKCEREKREDEMKKESDIELSRLKEKQTTAEEAEKRILETQHKQIIHDLREKLEKERESVCK